jgi:NHL repeat
VKEILASSGYTTVNTLGSGFNAPDGVVVDGRGNVFVADFGHNAVKEIMTQGVNFGSAAIATSTPLTIPLTFTFDTAGTIGAPAVLTQGAANLDFADAGSDTCTAGATFNAGDTCTLNVSFTPKFSGVRYGAATLTDGSGAVIATAYVYGTGLGPQVTFAPGTQSTLGSGFSFPIGVAVDGSGNVFVADSNNGAVKEILVAGGYTTVNTLGGGFDHPYGVAVDGSGNVFVADTNHSAVKEVLAAGGYTTINTLGSGFAFPKGVAVDASGNVFVADSNHNAIVKLDFADPPSLGFASTAVGSTSSDSPQTVTLTNIGNAALTFPVPATGLNPSIAAGFTIGNSSTCPQLSSSSSAATLAPGASCTNLISFAPASVGSISGSLVTTDDHLNAAAPGYATQSIALSGTGTAGTPTIAFTVPGHTFGDAPFTVSATSNSTGAFTYTVVSGPATIAGSTVTLTGAGTVMLQASEAADANYTTSTENANFMVSAGTPAIVFTVPNHTYADAPLTVSATSNSTGTFTYTVVSGPATIAGSTVTLTGVGTVMLQASEAADTNYTTSTKNANFMVSAGTPAISFTVPNHSYGDAPFTVSATSNSTGAFTYTVVSGPATISGSTVTLTGVGTVVLQASEAADANYTASTQNASFPVAGITPTISFTVPNHTYGDAPFTVSATSNSTGVFTYSVVSGPATVSGATVTLTGAGTVVLQASEAADANFTATTKNAIFEVAAITPTINFTVPNHTYGDAPFTVSATSNSTGAFTYTVVSGPATISGATVTLTGAGTVVLSASQVASGNYAPTTATTSFTVAASFTLSSGPGTGSTSGTATVAPGAAATFTLTLSPGGVATYPDALTLSATGLPTGATATFSPATIAAGSAVTPVTLTIQTSSQTARSEKPSSGEPFAPVALGFLLLPLAGMKRVRRRLGQMPRLTVALVVMVLSLGAVLGLSGCGGSSSPGATAKSYTVVVTATDVTTGAHTSANITLNVQ